MCRAVVPHQLPTTCETLPALVALVRPVRLVQTPVVSQAARVRELLSALTAFVPFQAGVSTAHMFFQVLLASEFLAAHGARVFSGMHTPVIGKLPAPYEITTADIAVVRAFPGVEPVVFEKFAGRVEPPSADVALESPILVVNTLVFGERPSPRETLQTDVALERLLARVGPSMVDELGVTRERPAAHLTVLYDTYTAPRLTFTVFFVVVIVIVINVQLGPLLVIAIILSDFFFDFHIDNR